MLSLLEVDRDSYPDENSFIKRLREQITDTTNPDNMLNDYSTRLTIHETGDSYRNGVEDVGFVTIDIHTTQDKDRIDRRHLVILKRLIEILDSGERKARGKQPLDIGLEGLVYRSRPSSSYVSTGWEKHSIVFEYKFLTNFY